MALCKAVAAALFYRLIFWANFTVAQQPPESAAGSTATISSAAQLPHLLATLAPPVSLIVTGDLLFNATNWPDPIRWPGGGGHASLSSVTTGGPKPVLTFKGQRIATTPAPASQENKITTELRASNSASSGNSSIPSELSPSCEQEKTTYRLPRVDFANMQGRLHLDAGAMLVLRNLEVSGTTLGTWLQHETLEVVSESSGATVVIDSCLLHNTVCPAAADLLNGYTALRRAAGFPGFPGNQTANKAASASGVVRHCYSPAVLLVDVTSTLPNYGQVCFRPCVLSFHIRITVFALAVGGYTTVIHNTTLLCDMAVPKNCTQTKSERDCFLELLANVPPGITADVVLKSAAVHLSDGPFSDGGGGGSGRWDRFGLVAGISGAVGGAGGLLVAVALYVILVRRRGQKCGGGLPGCFDLRTDSCKLEDIEEAVGSIKGPLINNHLTGGGAKKDCRSCNQPSSSSETNTITTNESVSIVAGTESGIISAAGVTAGGPGFGAAAAAVAVGMGGGLEGLLEQQRQLSAPDDIRLNVLLGAGSFGRVYGGIWRDGPCAVKILTHGTREMPIIERELQVSLSCKHPNVVATMHFVRLDVTRSAAGRLQQLKASGGPQRGGGGGIASGSSGVDMFPTPGRSRGGGGGGAESASSLYETWLIQELCDGGALSSALYGGRSLGVVQEGRRAGSLPSQVDMPAILSLALDISRGMAYLHKGGIVHGDLKAENVLLRARSAASDSPSKPQLQPANSSSSNSSDSSSSGSSSSGSSSRGKGKDAATEATVTGEGTLRPEGTFKSGATLPLQPPAAADVAGTPRDNAVRSWGDEDDDDGGRGAAVAFGPTASKPPASYSSCRYVAKVADFGLSRALDPGRTHQTTRNVGTITHMPPESLMGGQMHLATDVYAFVWELYTGSRPYSGLTAGEVVHRVVAQGSRPAFPCSAPPAWCDLAAECWAQEPGRRPTFAQAGGTETGGPSCRVQLLLKQQRNTGHPT
ncbi:hypothetical protein VOLCADRAFT_119213 [Volvox carteri f. nagariensis]|uniref:Protein kinase domain-containing protein n=1 Tax=Volvox carteri f. nagariensis TaxID=3068 RepID=D8UB56_VOLCA|nr:uncharacterized protein VOLCADRAFT_119213 [Volvox carteri f. nagariensis]EFJ43113.1 hypothetical protein VOLCADRAFT_119213 [Volvox carteri f. nagariensis]|eukprot:XP_002955912.1 hypothetical protein VOLCADRAFT_119213 [Volvox carteri f. nagariensis]